MEELKTVILELQQQQEQQQKQQQFQEPLLRKWQKNTRTFYEELKLQKTLFFFLK